MLILSGNRRVALFGTWVWKGGSVHPKLNIAPKPIANKYREGKVKRTLKRELKVPEIVELEACSRSLIRIALSRLRSKSLIFVFFSRQCCSGWQEVQLFITPFLLWFACKSWQIVYSRLYMAMGFLWDFSLSCRFALTGGLIFSRCQFLVSLH